jgi:hypothetical protein
MNQSRINQSSINLLNESSEKGSMIMQMQECTKMPKNAGERSIVFGVMIR